MPSGLEIVRARAVDRIKDGTITDYIYDSKTATLVRTRGADDGATAREPLAPKN